MPIVVTPNEILISDAIQLYFYFCWIVMANEIDDFEESWPLWAKLVAILIAPIVLPLCPLGW